MSADIELAEDFITCTICNDEFQDPRSLPCLHTFCKKCITSHIQENNNGQKSARGFSCPRCQRFVDPPDAHTPPSSWADYMTPNHMISSLIEGFKLRTDVRKCDPCFRRKDKVIAKKWCRECSEALCEQCEGFHKALKYSQHHVMVDIDDMRKHPMKETASRPPCPHHEGTVLGFFCEEHDRVVCSSCVTVDHRHCSHVTTSSEAADKQRTEGEELVDKLNHQKDWSKRIADNRRQGVHNLEETMTQVHNQVVSIREHVNELLAAQEFRVLEELKTLHMKERQLYDGDIEKCDGMVSTTDNAISLLKNSLEHATDTDMLITIHSARKESNLCVKTLADMSARLKDTTISFAPEKALQNLMNTLKDIGKLSVSYTPVQVSAPFNVDSGPEIESESDTSRPYTPLLPAIKNKLTTPSPQPSIASQYSKFKFITSSPAPSSLYNFKLRTPRSKQATPIISATPLPNGVSKPAQLSVLFKARTSNDRINCYITGADYVTDGRVVIVDQAHRKLKLFDHQYRWLGEKVLSSKPYDVTCVSGTEVAVTFPPDKKIQIFSVRDVDFVVLATIQTGAKCWGLSFNQRKLAVACYMSPPTVKIMSLDGRELRKINKDEAGHDLFFFPDYVALDKAGKNIYVTDRYKKSVISVTVDGQKRWEIRYDGMKNPRGLAVQGNRVLVAGSRTHNIVLLTTDGQIVGDIVADSILYPQKICLGPGADKILVSQHQATLIDVEKNTVKVFELP